MLNIWNAFKGELRSEKKTIIFWVLFSLILLVACKTTDVLESEREVMISQGNGSDDGVLIFLSELQNEIIESITKQTELKAIR